MVGHKRLSLDQLIKAPEMERIANPSTQDDDWVQVDFNQPEISEIKKIEPVKDDADWVMEKPGISTHPILQKQSIPVRSLEDDFYADEFEEYGDIEETNSEIIPNSDSPIVSHTLIDLYCAQQYYDKAIELLQKILELNPHDQASKQKLSQILEMKGHSVYSKSSVTEEDGHNELISIIESQVKAKSPKVVQLEETLGKFLNALKERSLNYR